eukprot:TRINITY_DN267_c0_g1_i4.p1 TRINITY_DN267_c0_g1~~TRINITY_DN267_c0_g1_i4.p1  ORF type:complete len:147 (-),score=26.34 TRINITY_DN267_c0_g1_i4:335-715(-)
MDADLRTELPSAQSLSTSIATTASSASVSTAAPAVVKSSPKTAAASPGPASVLSDAEMTRRVLKVLRGLKGRQVSTNGVRAALQQRYPDCAAVSKGAVSKCLHLERDKGSVMKVDASGGPLWQLRA